MWARIEITEADVESMWERVKDMPYVFDDASAGNFEMFKQDTLKAGIQWYKINDGVIRISDITPGEHAILHTIMFSGHVVLEDAWGVILDALHRNNLQMILSGVPEFNVAALKRSEKVGFRVTRECEEFGIKWGKPYRMDLMMITEEDICRQQSLLR